MFQKKRNQFQRLLKKKNLNPKIKGPLKNRALFYTMATVNDLLKKIQKVNVEEMAEAALYNTQDEYLAANKQQIWEGKNKDGSPIKAAPPNPYPYARLTVFFKNKTGLPTDRVTLLETGEMYRNMRMKIESGTIHIDSTVPYFQDLVDKYKSNFLGLSTESRKDFVNNIYQEEFVSLFKQSTDL